MYAGDYWKNSTRRFDSLPSEVESQAATSYIGKSHNDDPRCRITIPGRCVYTSLGRPRFAYDPGLTLG